MVNKMYVNKLYEMRKCAYSLMNGIDPTSGLMFPNDTIMNIVVIKKYNQSVCELLDALIVATEKEGITKSKKIPFFLLESNSEKISICETPISISKFCNDLNNYVLPGMKKLRASDLTKGLMKLGYLCNVIIDDEKSYKKPTEKGIELGILTEKRQNSHGNKYLVNLYNSAAQKYILSNLMEIIGKAKED